MATVADLAIDKGSTFIYSFAPLYEADGITPLDLTSYTAELQMRRTVASTLKILTLTEAVDGGITLNDDGTIDLLITDDVTAAVQAETGVYDLEITDGDGATTRAYQGAVTFSDEVTR